MPQFDRTLSHTFWINSSELFSFVFLLGELVLPEEEYLATVPPTLLIGAQTQLTITRSAAFCTSASATISPSAAPKIILIPAEYSETMYHIYIAEIIDII